MARALRVSSLFLILLGVSLNAQAYRIASWIPSWDGAALTSVQQYGNHLQESNPVWYSLSSDGSIVPNWNAENSSLRAAMTGSEVLPTIQNTVSGRYDGALVERLVATPESRERHAEAIAQLVFQKAFDGIDIDYERVPTRSREQFSAFIDLLGRKLHAGGKKLSVTVYAKTSDAQNWDGPGSQDYVRLGVAADSVKIMAYDFHWSTSTAGPITPLDWLDRVTGYAVSAIPPQKVMVGLPFFGYDWQGTSGKGIVWADAVALAQQQNAKVGRDANGEATFTYGDRTVFYQDAASYKRKLDTVLAKYPNIGGFAHWRSGKEDPAIWNVIAEAKLKQAQATMSINGPADLTLAPGGSTKGRFTVSGTFTGAATISVIKPVQLNANLRLSTTSVAAGGTTTLTVRTTKKTRSGTYSVVIRATAGSLVSERTVRVVVQ